METAARNPASAVAFLKAEGDGEEVEGKGFFAQVSRLAAEYGMVDCEAAHPGSVAGA